MQTKTTLLAVAVGLAMLAGCGKQDETAPVAEAPAPAANEGTAVDAASGPANGTAANPVDDAAPDPAPAVDEAAPPVAADAADFDLDAIPVSTATLPAWPYVQLPAGYVFDDADRLGERTKDLARIPVWTGGQLLWVEGKVFTDDIENADGKTFSKFELSKGLRQQIESLGGVRVSERSYDSTVFEANKKELGDFRQEFSDLQEAYWYDADVDTWVIRRPDSVIWIVAQARNGEGSVLVAEGPAPEAAGG